LNAFNTPNVYSQLENSKFSSGFAFNSQWKVKFDFNHLHQTGAKLQGVASDSSNGSPNATGSALFVIMTPTNYSTDTVNLALNWVGEKGFASTRYYGSVFRDAYSEVYFQNPFNSSGTATGTLGVFPTDMVSTMPSNELNQFKLNGGYALSKLTKLAGGISYSRNTQNSAFGQDATYPGALPQTSLQGLVNTTNADLKLSHRANKDLQLSASLKYNKRDNQTASNAYAFNMIASVVAPATTALNNTMNAPMSNSKTQFDVDGDYQIDKNQKLVLDYGYEEIKRWCNGINYPLLTPKTTTFAGYSPFSASTCAEVPFSNENKLTASYILKATDSLNFNAGLGYSNRVAEIDPFFYNPMQTTGVSNTLGVGSGFEFQQFMSYMDSSRREYILKLGSNWQVSDNLSFGFKGEYTFDKYDSVYGVQNGRSYNLNLDATYVSDEHSSISVYASSQNRTRDLTNLQSVASKVETSAGISSSGAVSAGTIASPANASWTNTLAENDLTIGIGTKQGGFIDDKLDLNADVTYSLNKSAYDTALNYSGLSGNGLSCSSPSFLTCGALPDIKSDLFQFKLVSTYKIDKDRKIKAGYLFQRVNATDYMYNNYQYGSTPATMMPTNQLAPSYAVNVVSVSYDISY
jgi:MtrB/PioB family decaheme-associated outer membrane protein